MWVDHGADQGSERRRGSQRTLPCVAAQRDKKTAQQMRGPQGAVEGTDASALDFSGAGKGKAVGGASSSGAGGAGPSTPLPAEGPAASGRNKKKKGKKGKA